MPLPPRAPVPTPFDITGGHFALSLVAFALGSALLPGAVPDLVRGVPFTPRTLALVHLFSLGVLGSAISGALYQFYPMALGVPARSVRIGRMGLAAWALGLLALIGGLWRWSPPLMGAGWGLLFLAVGATSWNLLPARRQTTVPDGRRIGWYVSAGHSALGIAMGLGLVRIGDAWGWWHTDQLAIIATHFHWGVVGFGTLTVLGVGGRMLPMFLLTGPTPSGPLRIIGPSIVAGLLLQGAGLLGGWPLLVLLGGAALIGAALMTILLLVRWWTGRHRPLEGGLDLLPTATAWLAISVALGSAVMFSAGRSFRLWEAYALAALLGWLILLVLAVLFRIVPHLSYIHLFGRRGGAVVPVDALVRVGWTRLVSVLLPLGL
ncbi:MAG TPA: hypothetical protein VF454_04250, partial [Gemmatimonadales bacterium]